MDRGQQVMFLVFLFLDSAAVLLSVIVTLLLVEILAALLLPWHEDDPNFTDDARPPVAILVPAHNESTGILPTLRDINAQLLSGDRLLVVADNCVDDTAVVAAEAGAEVVKREDLMRAGKGYALEFGLKHLSAEPPAIVIIIDADCRLAEATLDRLVKSCTLSRRPVQALDLMVAPDGSPVNYSVAEFAWRVKNWVRPLGLKALNLPCQLMGTGMAFPWEVIQSAQLASGSVVEDLKLGLELAQLGSPPLFCPSACVTSRFPPTSEAAIKQRKRWEGGHLSMILTTFSRLISIAVARRNFDLLVLTLDLAVPPVSVLAILLSVEFFIAGLLAVFGFTSWALPISFSSITMFGLGISICWLKYGRDVLPASAALSVPSYLLGKIPIYLRLLSRKNVLQWTKTDRKRG